MQLVRQVILLIYRKVEASLEQSEIFREINNIVLNDLKLSVSGLSLLLIEIYLFLFKVSYLFFPLLCLWEFFALTSRKFCPELRT